MDCWETEIKVLTNYSKTTLGGAISHSANSAPRSLGARKDETIIFGLARSRIQPGFSLLQSTGLFPPQAKSICHPACLQLEKWGLPWWPEHICTAWTWNKPIKDWQLLIGQLWADFRSSLVWRARIISHTCCQTDVGSFRFQQSFFCNWVRLYGRCIRCATSVSSRGCRAGSSLPNSDKNKTEHLSPSTHTSTLFCPEWKLRRKNKTKHLRKFNYPPFKPFVHVIFLFSWVVPQR